MIVWEATIIDGFNETQHFATMREAKQFVRDSGAYGEVHKVDVDFDKETFLILLNGNGGYANSREFKWHN